MAYRFLLASIFGSAIASIKAEPSNHLVTFHVMDCLTPHNVILGQNWLHKMKVVPSSYHQLLCYSTPE